MSNTRPSGTEVPKRKRHRRLNTILIVFIVFASILIAIGILTPPTPTNTTSSTTYQNYQDSRFGYSVQVPGGWEIFSLDRNDSVGITNVLSVHPPEGQGFSSSFTVEVDTNPGASTISQYYSVYREKLAQEWSSDGIVFNSNENTTLGGQPAFGLIWTVYIPNGTGSSVDTCPENDVATIHNGFAYIVSLNDCDMSDFNSHLTAFGNFVSSFQFPNS